jgi:hypothetical protein
MHRTLYKTKMTRFSSSHRTRARPYAHGGAFAHLDLGLNDAIAMPVRTVQPEKMSGYPTCMLFLTLADTRPLTVTLIETRAELFICCFSRDFPKWFSCAGAGIGGVRTSMAFPCFKHLWSMYNAKMTHSHHPSNGSPSPGRQMAPFDQILSFLILPTRS